MALCLVYIAMQVGLVPQLFQLGNYDHNNDCDHVVYGSDCGYYDDDYTRVYDSNGKTRKTQIGRQCDNNGRKWRIAAIAYPVFGGDIVQ